MIKPHFYNPLLFWIFGAGREQARCVRILHDFTNKVRIINNLPIENFIFQIETLIFLNVILNMMNDHNCIDQNTKKSAKFKSKFIIFRQILFYLWVSIF